MRDNYQTQPNEIASLVADIVALYYNQETASVEVLTIQRGKEPFQGHFALPGGHVQVGETFKTAAIRELLEETGITHTGRLWMIKLYDDPNRDPRGREISVAFLIFITPEQRQIIVDDCDDAVCAAWFKLGEQPELAFDHPQMVLDACWKAIELISDANMETSTFVNPIVIIDSKEGGPYSSRNFVFNLLFSMRENFMHLLQKYVAQNS